MRQAAPADGGVDRPSELISLWVRGALIRSVRQCPYLPHATAHSLIEAIDDRVAKDELDETGRDSHRVRTVQSTVAPGLPGGRSGRQASSADKDTGRLIDRIHAHLVEERGFPSDLIGDILRFCRESVLSDLITTVSERPEVRSLAEQLHRERRLTVTLLLRALVAGATDFVEAALARLSRIRPQDARTLIGDAHPLTLKALYRRAGLPDVLYPAFRVAVTAAFSPHGKDGVGVSDPDALRTRRIVESLQRQYEDIGQESFETILWRLHHRVSRRPD